MNTLRAAIIPGLIAGVISVFTSWLWMGVVFHRFQKETPGTWRAEGGSSYFGASVLHILSAIGVAVLFTLMLRFQVAFFSAGTGGSIAFAFCLWLAVSVPMITESSLFIRLHPMVVMGQLVDWLSLLVVTCVVTRYWVGN